MISPSFVAFRCALRSGARTSSRSRCSTTRVASLRTRSRWRTSAPGSPPTSGASSSRSRRRARRSLPTAGRRRSEDATSTWASVSRRAFPSGSSRSRAKCRPRASSSSIPLSTPCSCPRCPPGATPVATPPSDAATATITWGSNYFAMARTRVTSTGARAPPLASSLRASAPATPARTSCSRST